MNNTDSGDRVSRPCVMIIFGASGDLTQRKLIPALYNLEVDGLLEGGLRIVGFGRSELSDEEFRERLRRAAAESDDVEDFDGERWGHFARRISYVKGGYEDEGSYRVLAERLCDCSAGGEGYNPIEIR